VDNYQVEPGVWNVLAGKVNILKTMHDAVVRETQEKKIKGLRE